MALFTRVVRNDEENSKNEQEETLAERILEESEPEAMAEPVMAGSASPKVFDTEWLDKGIAEGQLSVDVYQTADNIVIKSTMAGVKPEDIDVAIDNDMVTVRGSRHQDEEIKEENYFYQECYWGDFSRSVVLPVEVKAEEAEAIVKNGVLTVILPKAQKAKSIAVKVKGE